MENKKTVDQREYRRKHPEKAMQGQKNYLATAYKRLMGGVEV